MNPDLEQQRHDEKIREAIAAERRLRIARSGNRSYEKDLYGDLSSEIGETYRRERTVFPTLGPNRKQRRAASKIRRRR